MHFHIRLGKYSESRFLQSCCTLAVDMTEGIHNRNHRHNYMNPEQAANKMTGDRMKQGYTRLLIPDSCLSNSAERVIVWQEQKTMQ
jgi:hypothetical protein